MIIVELWAVTYYWVKQTKFIFIFSLSHFALQIFGPILIFSPNPVALNFCPQTVTWFEIH